MYCEGVVGYYPYFYISKSTNAGVSWFDVSSWLGSEEGSYFCDINNGYISGYNNIYKTVNSCLNWTFISTGTYAYNYVLNFLNVDTGYIASGDDLNPFYIRKTTDGGYSWSNLYQITTPIFAGYFINSLTGFIGRNNILKTTNGGYNWYIQSSSYNTILYEIKFINQLTGFAIGDNGIILKTTNGGESTGISPINNNIPSDFSLSQNYPNPFNPTTKIKFDIPVDSRIRGNDRGRVVGSDRVVLRVYDILGKEIETLVNEKLNPGTYEVTFDASKYPSGVYFYRLITDNFTDTKRMILLK
jgi:hypothetical protein